jgi:hypothetical protein
MSSELKRQYIPFSNSILNPTNVSNIKNEFNQACWNTSNTYLYLAPINAAGSANTLANPAICKIRGIDSIVTDLVIYHDNNASSVSALGVPIVNLVPWNDSIFFVNRQVSSSTFRLYQIVTLNDSGTNKTINSYILPSFSSMTPWQVSYNPTNRLLYIVYLNVSNNLGKLITINPTNLPTPTGSVTITTYIDTTLPTLPVPLMMSLAYSVLTFDNNNNYYINLGTQLTDTNYNNGLYGIYKGSIDLNGNLLNPTTTPSIFIKDASLNFPGIGSSASWLYGLQLTQNYILARCNISTGAMRIAVFTYDGQLVTNDLIYLLNNARFTGVVNYEHCFTSDNVGNIYWVGATNGSTIQNRIYTALRIVCFKEDTQILTYDGYKLIQDLQKGDLVKTSQNGYKPIYKIGHTKITQQCLEEKINNQLYKCSTENFPEVFEDLILTGCHCILVDKFKDEKEREDAKKINRINTNNDDDDFITENKYRLPACIDERTTVYEVEGEHTIYHFALENDDYYMNYGVYANGLLVESTSKRFMDETHMNEITPPFNRFWGIFTNIKYFTFYKIFKTHILLNIVFYL